MQIETYFRKLDIEVGCVTFEPPLYYYYTENPNRSSLNHRDPQVVYPITFKGQVYW